MIGKERCRGRQARRDDDGDGTEPWGFKYQGVVDRTF